MVAQERGEHGDLKPNVEVKKVCQIAGAQASSSVVGRRVPSHQLPESGFPGLAGCNAPLKSCPLAAPFLNMARLAAMGGHRTAETRIAG